MREAPGMSRGLHRGRRTLRRAGSESTAIRFRGNEPPESPVEANEDLSVYRPPRAETEDGRPHKMVLTALDRRHTLAVTGTSADRSGQWTWTRHEGGGRAGGNWRKKEQRHICAAEGVVSKSPGGEPGERRGRRPLFVFGKNRKTSVFTLARRDVGSRNGDLLQRAGKGLHGAFPAKNIQRQGQRSGSVFFPGKNQVWVSIGEYRDSPPERKRPEGP